MKQTRIFSSVPALIAIAFVLLVHPGCEKENQPPGCMITDPELSEEIPHGTQVSIFVDASDTDGDVYGVSFYINDVGIGTANSIPFHYIWNTLDNEAGKNTIRAVAKDDLGLSNSHEITVTLTEGVPEAGFSVYQTSVCPDSSAQFYNRSINNSTSWLWDFGDGTTSTLENPSHVYTSTGIYTVSLRVTNSYGTDFEIKDDYIVVPEPLSDYDGNVYQTVQIGEQLWMKENLKTTHYADGTALIDGREAGDISGDYITKYYFSYNDNEGYVAEYGRLYTWAAAVNGVTGNDSELQQVQGVCPDGWHVPGDDEWQELEMYLGLSEREADQTWWRGTTEGLTLKEPGTSHWTSDYRDIIFGTNESGFSALAGGSRLYNESYREIEKRAHFWSATESIGIYAWQRRLYYDYAQIYRYDDYKSRGYSVRCVKD